MKGFQAAKLRNKFDRTCKEVQFAALSSQKIARDDATFTPVF